MILITQKKRKKFAHPESKGFEKARRLEFFSQLLSAPLWIWALTLNIQVLCSGGGKKALTWTDLH